MGVVALFRRLNGVDHQGVGAAAFIKFAGGGNTVSGKFGEAGVSSFGGHSAVDGPVDGAVLGEDDELGTFLGAGESTFTADGFVQIFGEGAGGVEHIAFNGYGFLLGEQRGGEGQSCEDNGGRYSFY